MDDAERDALVSNIVGHASDDVTPEMQLRVVAYWTRVDEQIGRRVAEGLGLTNGAAPGRPGDARGRRSSSTRARAAPDSGGRRLVQVAALAVAHAAAQRHEGDDAAEQRDPEEDQAVGEDGGDGDAAAGAP